MYIDPLLLTLIIVCDLFAVAYFALLYRYLHLQGRKTAWLIYPILCVLFGLFTMEFSLIQRIAAWQMALQLFGSQMHKP